MQVWSQIDLMKYLLRCTFIEKGFFLPKLKLFASFYFKTLSWRLIIEVRSADASEKGKERERELE